MVREKALYETLELEVDCTVRLARFRPQWLALQPLTLLSHPGTEIQNAYETLSDPESREKYDLYGSDAGRGGGGGGSSGMDEEDLMNAFFGGQFGGGGGGRRAPGGAGGGPRSRRKTQTSPSVVELKVTLEELYNGKEATIEIQRARTCGTCHGTGAKAKAKPRQCFKCQGNGIVYAMQNMGPFVQRIPVECPICDGRGQTFRDQDACKKCRATRTTTDKKRLTINVERGMMAGETIILRGEGDESPDSSAPGDLHIQLSVFPHATFTVSPTIPLQLHTTISLTLSESLLGFDRLVLVHLDRRGLRVNQPKPGEKGWRVLKSGDLVVVKGEGLWRKGERGDLVLKVEVEMPSKDWATSLGSTKLKQLESLLPPKRADIPNPDGEMDEVVLEPYVPDTNAGGRQRGRATDSDDEQEEQGGAPGCHQQ
ncbi:hypothetical protein P7C70_g8060, partial [Phenoliferia sp. Uapishka_3]